MTPNPSPPPVSLSAAERGLLDAMGAAARIYFEQTVLFEQYAKGQTFEQAEQNALVQTLKTFPLPGH